MNAGGNVTELDPGRAEHLRMVEAVLFASAAPMSAEDIARRLPEGVDVQGLIAQLARLYEGRGVHLAEIGGQWAFRTAPDLAHLMHVQAVETRKLSRAGVETLAIIAYHQPATRAEIEEVRGVAVSKGTIDLLLELGWIRFGRRRMTPGRPITFVTTEAFLDHFGLASIKDLPGVADLKAAGLLNAAPPADFDAIPEPKADEREDDSALDDEDGERD